MSSLREEAILKFKKNFSLPRPSIVSGKQALLNSFLGLN